MSGITVLVIVALLVAFAAGAAVMAGIVFFGLPSGTSQREQPTGAGPGVPQTRLPIGQSYQTTNPTPAVKPITAPEPGAGPQVPQATQTQKSGLTPTATPGPSPQTAGAKVTPSPAAQVTPVDFDLLVMQTEPPKTTVLLNATVLAKLNAALSNLSDTDAHNVRVQIRARVGTSYIKVNSADPFVLGIGDLAARTTTSQNLTLEMKMSLARGRQAQSEGIIFEITVLSNERNKQFPNMRCTQTSCNYS